MNVMQTLTVNQLNALSVQELLQLNKLVVSSTAGTTLLDRIRVGQPRTDAAHVYEAEAARIAGTATSAPASRASGGRVEVPRGSILVLDRGADSRLSLRISDKRRARQGESGA